LLALIGHVQGPIRSNRYICWVAHLRLHFLLLKILEDRVNDANALQLFVLLEGYELVIKVVIVKLLLNRSFFEAQLVFLELLIISITPLLVYILLVKVVLLRRNKRTFHLSLSQVIPWKIPQPNMLFDLFYPISTQPILRLSLNHAVYEIRCSSRPPIWNVTFSYLHLLLQDMVSYLLTRFAHIRPPPKHTFICHNAHCKVVHTHCVILPAHHFRCHIPRRARRILLVVFTPDARNSKISDSQVA